MCGKELAAQEVIPATGHTEEVVPGKAATCEETGLTEGKKCSVCGKELAAQEVIPALGHTEEVIPGKEPTCTKAGLTDGLKCSVCGKVFAAREVIPALGHDYKKQEPTSLIRTEYKCARCGMLNFTDEKNAIMNFYGSILINAKGKYVDYIASVDPKDDSCLVITAVLNPKAANWTSEIGMYLSRDVIKQIMGDGFQVITYVNGKASLNVVLTSIDGTTFDTAEAIDQCAYITDPEAENGCLVKVEGVTAAGRAPSVKFAPMDLEFNGQKILVAEDGIYPKAE